MNKLLFAEEHIGEIVQWDGIFLSIEHADRLSCKNKDDTECFFLRKRELCERMACHRYNRAHKDCVVFIPIERECDGNQATM